MGFEMRSNRIAWLLLTAAAAAAYLFENQTGTRILISVLLILPAVSLALLWLSGGEISAEADPVASLERGAVGSLRLRFRNTGRLPASVRGSIAVRNLLTGEMESQPVSVSVPGRGEAEGVYELLTTHCGGIEAALRDLHRTDPLGLFAKKACADLSIQTTVLPRIRPILVTLAETADFLSDSLQYSNKQPGYDPSETFRIREYVPGDPIRRIHWKLSEKLDKLQVRDFGLPIVERMLLLMETTGLGGVMPDADAADKLLDLLASVSASLSTNGTSHVLGWQDAETEACVCREIHAPEDLEPVLTELLRNPLKTGGTSVCGCFARTYARCAYAHAAVFSENVPPELDLLFHGNRVTALLPVGAAAEQNLWTQGAELVVFTDETTELEL